MISTRGSTMTPLQETLRLIVMDLLKYKDGDVSGSCQSIESNFSRCTIGEVEVLSGLVVYNALKCVYLGKRSGIRGRHTQQFREIRCYARRTTKGIEDKTT